MCVQYELRRILKRAVKITSYDRITTFSRIPPKAVSPRRISWGPKLGLAGRGQPMKPHACRPRLRNSIAALVGDRQCTPRALKRRRVSLLLRTYRHSWKRSAVLILLFFANKANSKFLVSIQPIYWTPGFACRYISRGQKGGRSIKDFRLHLLSALLP